MITSQRCPQHECPLIWVGDEAVCLIEHVCTLLDDPIQDLVVDQGLIVLIFSGNVLLPLVGWVGNRRATDDDGAIALLDILAGLYLSSIR